MWHLGVAGFTCSVMALLGDTYLKLVGALAVRKGEATPCGASCESALVYLPMFAVAYNLQPNPGVRIGLAVVEATVRIVVVVHGSEGHRVVGAGPLG